MHRTRRARSTCRPEQHSRHVGDDALDESAQLNTRRNADLVHHFVVNPATRRQFSAEHDSREHGSPKRRTRCLCLCL